MVAALCGTHWLETAAKEKLNQLWNLLSLILVFPILKAEQIPRIQFKLTCQNGSSDTAPILNPQAWIQNCCITFMKQHNHAAKRNKTWQADELQRRALHQAAMKMKMMSASAGIRQTCASPCCLTGPNTFQITQV